MVTDQFPDISLTTLYVCVQDELQARRSLEKVQSETIIMHSHIFDL